MSWLRTISMVAFIALLAGISPAFPQRLPQPQLRPGQNLFYQIDFSSSRDVQVESSVTATSQVPQNSRVASSGILLVEVVSVSKSEMELKTYFSERQHPGQALPSAPDKLVTVTLTSDGSVARTAGWNELSVAQQMAWSAWLTKFAASMTFPKPAVRIHQNWKITEPETAPSPIDRLFWMKKFSYLRDESCGQTATAVASDANRAMPANESCAVILVQASLRQKSPAKDTSPEEYRRRGLKTSGTATGQNETILYISHRTGLVMRSTEDAGQSMDVTVALTDGSNQVRYTLKARSRSEIRLLPESAVMGQFDHFLSERFLRENLLDCDTEG